MTRLRHGGAAGLAVVAMLLGACASAPADRYFVLDAAASSRAAVDPAYSGDLNVRVAAIPQSVDRPQIVVQRGANELDLRDTDRWAEPLRGALERCLIQDLRRALPGAWIAGEGLHRDAEPLRLVIDFAALEALPDGTVRLRADWAIGTRGTPGRRAHSLSLARNAGTTATGAIVAAWSDEIDELAQGIARSITARGTAADAHGSERSRAD